MQHNVFPVSHVGFRSSLCTHLHVSNHVDRICATVPTPEAQKWFENCSGLLFWVSNKFVVLFIC